jgi:hypothetical protein
MTTQKKERSKQPVWRGHSCPPLSAHHLFDVGASVRARPTMILPNRRRMTLQVSERNRF